MASRDGAKRGDKARWLDPGAAVGYSAQAGRSMRRMTQRVGAGDWCWFAALLIASSAALAWSGRMVGTTFDEPAVHAGGARLLADRHAHGNITARNDALAARRLRVATAHLRTAARPADRAAGRTGDAAAVLSLGGRCRGGGSCWPACGDWRTVLAVGGAARLAIVFPALEPTMLAHAGLATFDVPVTAVLCLWLETYFATRQMRLRYRVGLLGVLFGVAAAGEVDCARVRADFVRNA